MHGFEAFDTAAWLQDGLVVLAPRAPMKAGQTVRRMASRLVVTLTAAMGASGTAWASDSSIAFEPQTACVVMMPALAPTMLRVSSALSDLARAEYWGELVEGMKGWRAVNEVSARTPAPMF